MQVDSIQCVCSESLLARMIASDCRSIFADLAAFASIHSISAILTSFGKLLLAMFLRTRMPRSQETVDMSRPLVKELTR